MLTESTRQEILGNLRLGGVLIIVGETGSGKSTEIPQIVAEHTSERVVVTQPRRVAAISVCEFVKKTSTRIKSEEIAYKVRFRDTTSENTVLMYCTDGILLNLLEDGSCPKNVILDEVHERSVRTDVLLGLLKRRIRRTRLVLMSATADVASLKAYFLGGNIPVHVCTIPSRKHNVEIKYLLKGASDYIQAAHETVCKIVKDAKKRRKRAGTDSSPENEEKARKKSGEMDEVDCIFSKVESLPKNRDIFTSGSILVFVSGLEDIEELFHMLQALPGVEVLKLHSSLPDAQQKLVFSRREKPVRVIVSTNIAETSLTIEDVKWVVDSGVQKINVTRDGIDALGIVKISKSSAQQRAGRAGRVCPGICYRLYTESAFSKMRACDIPEILRVDISAVSLSLLGMRIDPEKFEFFESPGRNALAASLSDLYVLGLIDEEKKVTDLGRKVSRLPLSPSLGKFLVLGKSLGVGCSAAAVCSLLGSEKASVFSRETDTGSVESVYKAKEKASDLTLYASLFFTYLQCKSRLRSDLCKSLGVSHQEMKRAESAYEQLVKLMRVKGNLSEETESLQEMDRVYVPLREVTADRLHAAATGGFLTRVAALKGKGAYTHLYSGKTVYVHPSSCMFRRVQENIAFILTAETTKTYVMHAFPYTSEMQI
ncbi:ATP-dependent RNA helicase DHX8/PRP22 [Nematocida major]|uniref:ATP-dependent RNA helicase DHX8/PRP22 n=1 Tax=Nematocida major TaxID=1912982 RepID=UPI002008DA9C|nr:ATP-dependent RNA helicase DHX8/PRP22 [Nematocida major]KAH9385300.1 ATP-dependent RNA helicase DHX8/PRP22 [Nematocida major]